MDTGLKQVCILGLAFFFLFGAYNTLQNLLTTLLTDNNEGFVSLAVLYTSVAPSLVMAPWLTRRAGAKATLLLGVPPAPDAAPDVYARRQIKSRLRSTRQDLSSHCA